MEVELNELNEKKKDAQWIVETEKKFEQMLRDYNIDENEEMLSRNIFDRILVLQHQMVDEYCKTKKIPVQYMENVDTFWGFKNLSLTENINLLEAMINVTLKTSMTEDYFPIGSDNFDEKSFYIYRIVDNLYEKSKTLAVNVIKGIIYLFSKSSQAFISQILFSDIWKPAEVFQFYLEVCSQKKSDDIVESILQQVQTYHIRVGHAIIALQDDSHLENQIMDEKDKDVKSVIEEMKSSGYPERTISILEEVLHKVFLKLPDYQLADLDEKMKREGIKETQDLDFSNPNTENLIKILIGISVAVEDTTTVPAKNPKEKGRGYFPRVTQLASLLTLLLSQTQDSKGCLLEIATGEGKSCIVAMFALIQAIRGKTVDIITSSPVLAVRDQEEWKKLYEMFDVTCDVNPPKHLETCAGANQRDERIQEAYRSQIVYGTVDSFAADILRQEFEKKNTRMNRRFDIAIVDEVDYMTLDSGVQVTFLSHEATGMRHLDQLLTAIWTKLCMCQMIEEADTGEVLWMTGIQYFHKLATDVVMGETASDHFSSAHILMAGVHIGLISEEELQNINTKETTTTDYADIESQELQTLLSKFGPQQQRDLLTIFATALNNSFNFKFYEFRREKAAFTEKSCATENNQTISVLLMDQGQASLLMTEKDLINATVDELSPKLKFSDSYNPNEMQDGEIILLPGHLRKYTENRLRIFVENALRAIVMKKEREYTIDCRGQQNTPENHCIIPIDFKSTGVLEKNKRWGDGLQQFLEIKHHLALSPLSNVTNFMSNFHLFQRYTNGSGIFGVSGTLGDETDFMFLKKHYNVSCYIMPTHRYTKKVELPVLQVEGGRDLWITEICKCIKSRISPTHLFKSQAVLVICEDMKTANELNKNLMELEDIAHLMNITMYTRSDKHTVEIKTFDSGSVILATNLAGRGTDIKVTEQVNCNGGLFVILTHFPSNRRVEKQIFGRTSRKGNPGMVHMILNQQNLASCYQGQPVEVMRQLRANYEMKRIAEMENDELVEVKMRHQLFTFFCQQLKMFDQKYSTDEKEDIYTSDKVYELPCFLTNSNKIDYRPALNALKETWALWLTLHEEDINEQKDLDTLKEDLRLVIQDKIENIVNKKSDNFYDFVKVAMDRTYLHMKNQKQDYGALYYWEKVEQTDCVYRAISLYNRAFIKVNLQKGDYKQEAINLLVDAKKAIDVYVSEVSNIATFGNLTQRTQFEPHNKETNLTLQLQTRMNLIKSWTDYIDSSVDKLKELQDANKDAIAEEKIVFSLTDNYGKIVTDEMSMLYDYGLSFVFEVKQKPEFCLSALICALLGVLQVLAGILVCGLTCGVASQFGTGLISEGISDVINGVEGMIKGSFSWAEWAVTKATSIALSLVTFGFNLLKKSIKSHLECDQRITEWNKIIHVCSS
ncbi:hypothetical protein XELAEV_18040004mg [Xenopus laevis]|uniref:Protein translocase subunit SecA n=1 Tax=Xenopus laevis TaxID=8355 RepID=A0A974H8W9_XENLA|nr:hypothetical protein XELAEV_18040004mg [Xenopus laevis]